MAFKFLAVVYLFGLVAAGDYEYNNPSNNNNPATLNEPHNDNNTNSYSESSLNTNNNNFSNNNNNSNNNNFNNNNNENSNNNNAEQLYTAPVETPYNSASPNLDNTQDTPFGYDYRPQQRQHQQLPYGEYNGPAKYDYSYNVHDETTGDIKSHAETRDGYLVRGVYTVVDPDGFKRTVTYTADDVSGFNAIVNREPYAIKAAVLATPAVAKPKLVDLPVVNTQHPLQQSTDEPASRTAELPIQPRDSYVAPPISRDGEGPYP